MPALIRKLVIFASRDGVVLQPHGADQQQAVLVEYKSRNISVFTRNNHDTVRQDTHLESHGIIGLITIASVSFLVAITRREQVAQIFGKPIYVIADVAILPLSSQFEAQQAIDAASQTQQEDGYYSESDFSDSEGEQRSVAATELATSPGEDDASYAHMNRSNTSIAEDVAKRNASYGKFASQWFSRRMLGAAGVQNRHGTVHRNTNSRSPSLPSIELQNYSSTEAEQINKEPKEEIAEKGTVRDRSQLVTNASAISLLPKILRSTKMILSSRSFFFAYEFDLTRRFAVQVKHPPQMVRDKLEQLYFWNRRIGSAFLDGGFDSFLTPIIQGFVGQRTFSVRPSGKIEVVSDTLADLGSDPETLKDDSKVQQERPYLLTLISRRSVKRSGLRYLRRGIDDDGNCANMVETEQILSAPTWAKETSIRSFIQIRGSIPLYFSQSPYSLKPVPVLHNSPSANEAAFRRHFQVLKNQYGSVQIAVLVDKHGTEVNIGKAYEDLYQKLYGNGQLSDVNFEWFDFHAECRGMKFENVQRLVDKFQSHIASWGETLIINDTVKRKQGGVIRTNCMDCLDRTNVAQSAFGQHVLQKNLQEDGYDIDLLHDESTNWFNILWADNGDAISRQYASTAALKGDFTRTRKRNWRGQMNDLGLTLSRYYSNMVNDYFSQAVIDFLLANVTWRIFEDFESTMMSADPGISVETAREAAVDNCAKIAIQDSDEDLIHGWTLLTPAQENTLRTLPFEETVVLLTDAAIYCCKFDWNTEKIASFEKVDLRSISKIRLGTYITSTFTDLQLNEQLNQGLVIVYTPGTDDVKRVNTRSLSNSISPEATDRAAAEGGPGILSWFSSKGSASSRTLALKVIPRNSVLQTEHGELVHKDETPFDMAKRIGEEIERAIIGPNKPPHDSSFIEEGDIISAAEAKKRTGYLEQLGHSIKKMVWA